MQAVTRLFFAATFFLLRVKTNTRIVVPSGRTGRSVSSVCTHYTEQVCMHYADMHKCHTVGRCFPVNI